MTKPLVSIIIPVFNAAKNLTGTIESAIAQTWPDKEIIIVDDGSTDNSLLLAKKYATTSVKIFSQENKGAGAARNKGLSEARGTYIQFLDADDLLSADKIEGQIEVLHGSVTHLGLCKTQYFYDGHEQVKQSPRESWYYADHNDPVEFLIKLYTGNDVMPGFGGMIQPNAWLTPRALIDKAGIWNEFRSPDDDGEFFCRVVLASNGIKFSDKGYNYYRRYRYSESLSGQKSLVAFEKMTESIDYKYKYLKERTDDILVDRIFARHYYWTGVSAYPKHKAFSAKCIERAKSLDYSGKKYVGGPAGHKIAAIFGWKTARVLVYYTQALKRLVLHND